MAFSYSCLMLQRVLIPTILVLAALFRPVGISFVYLLMFFISPFIPIATKRNFKGSVTAYLIILVALSSILLLCHIGLQVTIIAVKVDTLFGTCSFTEQLLRHVGFVDLRNLSPTAVVEWLVPEVAVFVTSLVVYLVTKRLTGESVPGQLENGEADIVREALRSGAEGELTVPVATSPATVLPDALSKAQFRHHRPNFDKLIQVSPLFCLATLFFAGVLRPSVPGGFYFLIFLLSGSYWATFQSLQRGFALLLRFVMIVIFLHTLCIVSYQTPWMQQHLDSNNLIARLIGLEPLIKSSCQNDIRVIIYDTSFKADSFLSPIVLFFSYFALALTTKNLIKPRLVRHTSRKSQQSPTIVAGELHDIQLESRGIVRTLDDGPNDSVFDQISYGFVSVGGFIYQNSYIFTNILMMTWSIVYHGWLTFVLLLWANVLWMIPNQRKAMMRSSPFIVIYAELLVVAQYVYGMNLTNQELPSNVDTTGINLAQIGLERPQDNNVQPCVPLIVKTAFLLMFWVTLRQFFKEKNSKRRGPQIADVFTQFTVESVETDYDQTDGKKTSKFLKKAGDIIKNLLVRLWIWLLVLVIFLCAITGKRMTGFRICYMALFLFFLLVFQSSSKAWLKVMYGFWLFLIFYAMSILILIYSYQFDKFDQYWNDYLNISKTLQSDIGLERYKTKDLFLHLVSPTIIVILTVIQVHYFHRRFIASLQQPSKPSTPIFSSRTSLGRQKSVGRLSIISASPDFEQSMRELVRLTWKKMKNRTKRFLKNCKDVFWRFLELHIIKAVYITAFACCISEVCLLHIVFAGLCILGVVSRNSLQVFISRVISFIVTIIVLAKMIYQVAYLDHSRYDVFCQYTNRTVNNAVWFGLEKASPETGGLMGLVKYYIIYMVIVTLHAVVSLRQYQMRTLTGQQSAPSPKVLFPSVTRADAEKNLKGMIKFLLNYGFYKFGLEVTLIWLVTTIAYRQDIVAIAYAIWLFVLLLMDRSKCAKIWIIFQCFIAISLMMQYILLVHLPPGFCLSYPWTGSPFSESIQRWAMLPGNLDFNHVSKLFFDFLLLMIINRQKRVFNIELKFGANYPGGSNQSVLKDIENLSVVPFENPTSDFLSHVRNYLDVFKNAVLCGFYWITLAVVFLAGTNISDLMALGYLIGAFIFLWEGSDFYLRPIKTIIYRWNLLLTYNVANILFKTSLQMVGCLFMKQVTTNCCWLVHLLGISCEAKENMATYTDDQSGFSSDCPSTTKQVAILWDAICFGFLVLQLRIFKSHYFCHMIIDTKANNILASRGAEIIEDLRQKQIDHRQQHEKEVLLKIKRKMEKIRATQQKMLRPLDKPTHFDEYDKPIHSYRQRKRKEIKLHPQAVRAGDYYMFEDMDEKFELDLIDDEADYLEDNNKIDETDKKLARRKTLIDSERGSQKPIERLTKTVDDETDMRPTTSKEATTEEKIKKAESGEIPQKDSDADLEANPIVRLMEGFLVSLTLRLNRFSRNYRYVNKILADEKKALKESDVLFRSGRQQTALFALMTKNLNSGESDDESASSSSTKRISARNKKMKLSPNNTNNHNTNTVTENPPIPLSQDQPQHQQQQAIQPHAVDIESLDTVYAKSSSKDSFVSLKGAGPSNYVYEEDDFTAREHHITIELLIASWFAILSNTDLICYIVVFINQVMNASIISLPLPIMIFLWGTLSLPRPTKTFWVTLIAYTQAIVLIKCIFQFKLIWANYINLPNQPLAPAKIFGVELDPNYASYDLLLLLVLFFHRFILKSQGLWKSEYKEGILMRSTESSAHISVDNEGENPSDANALVPAEQESKSVPEISSISSSIKSDDSLKGKLKRDKYMSSLCKFFSNLVNKPRLPADVYALMFLCDFINFFVLLFGFTAFGSQQTEGDGGVQKYLAENKVPIPFLIMLLVQFILIVIDRALYLRKALVQKIVFHFLSVIGIHIWMFFVVPAVTERSFYSLAPPMIFYIIKCFYMLFSSYQIKCGYPKRILGNFLTKGFSLANMISFKVYMQIPFLYELRTILDWVCTDTTMTLFDWLKMEDIFSDIYFIKCSRQMETDFPAIRAQKKALYTKLMMGGTFILLIVISIWGPLCLFALGNAVGQANVPYEVGVSIRIGPYDPIYETKNRESIFTFDQDMYADMQNAYIKDKFAITFLSSYDAEDIAAAKLAGNSPSMWAISPPDKDRLLNDLKTGVPLIARFTYTLTRIPPAKGLTGTVGSEATLTINSTFDGREAMIGMLEGRSEEGVVELPHMMPKFIKVLNAGDTEIVNALMPDEEELRPLTIKIHATNVSDNYWWEIRDFCGDAFYTNTLSKLPLVDCESGIVIYTFNDKKFPSTFSFLTAGGIIGLYTTFVLLASRFLKSFIAGSSRRIMFEDLPYVDRVLQLCLDIYLVREALEFALEEDLFAKLLFLYRSPETMIKWTRPKEDVNDDETDSESLRSRASFRRAEQL